MQRLPPCFQFVGENGKWTIISALYTKSFHNRLARCPRYQVSGFRFKYSPVHAIEVNLRPAFRNVTREQFLVFDLRRSQHLYRTSLEAILVTGCHPQDASAEQKPPLPFALVFIPKGKCPRGHLGVRRLGAVCPPNDARLSSRGST